MNRYLVMHIRTKKSINFFINFKKVSQITIIQSILMKGLIMKLYQKMVIFTLIMQYLPAIIKRQQYTFILIAKYYLIHAHFTTIVPQKMVDQSISIIPNAF